jgi:hypothetical protein
MGLGKWWQRRFGKHDNIIKPTAPTDREILALQQRVARVEGDVRILRGQRGLESHDGEEGRA